MIVGGMWVMGMEGGVGIWPHFEMSICAMSVGYITVWLDLVQDYQIWKCELTSIICFLFE